MREIQYDVLTSAILNQNVQMCNNDDSGTNATTHHHHHTITGPPPAVPTQRRRQPPTRATATVFNSGAPPPPQWPYRSRAHFPLTPTLHLTPYTLRLAVGFDVVIVCTSNASLAEYWQERLEASRGEIIRSDAIVLAVDGTYLHR